MAKHPAENLEKIFPHFLCGFPGSKSLLATFQTQSAVSWSHQSGCASSPGRSKATASAGEEPEELQARALTRRGGSPEEEEGCCCSRVWSLPAACSSSSSMRE